MKGMRKMEVEWEKKDQGNKKEKSGVGKEGTR